MKAMILRALALYFLLWIFRHKTSPVKTPLEEQDEIIPESNLDTDNFFADKEL
jgi:hypothetical protein